MWVKGGLIEKVTLELIYESQGGQVCKERGVCVQRAHIPSKAMPWKQA